MEQNNLYFAPLPNFQNVVGLNGLKVIPFAMIVYLDDDFWASVHHVLLPEAAMLSVATA